MGVDDYDGVSSKKLGTQKLYNAFGTVLKEAYNQLLGKYNVKDSAMLEGQGVMPETTIPVEHKHVVDNGGSREWEPTVPSEPEDTVDDEGSKEEGTCSSSRTLSR